MPNPYEEKSASSKATNQDLMDMEILCAFKINLGSQNLDQGFIKAQGLYPNHNMYS